MIDGSLVINEDNWFGPHKDHPYATSKSMAEQVAWNIYFKNKGRMNLTVINPSLVLGTYLTPYQTNSSRLISRIFSEKASYESDRTLFTVSIESIVDAHINALLNPE